MGCVFLQVGCSVGQMSYGKESTGTLLVILQLKFAITYQTTTIIPFTYTYQPLHPLINSLATPWITARVKIQRGVAPTSLPPYFLPHCQQHNLTVILKINESFIVI